MPNAYSYIRFSSKKQAAGFSRTRQAKQVREYAAEHNLTLVEKSYEDLGISAFAGKNVIEGALGKFLNAVESGVIPKGSYLLVENLDRVSRQNVLDAMSLFLRIISSGIVLVTMTDKQVFTREIIQNDSSKLNVALGGLARAHDESKIKAERTTKNWDEKLAKTDEVLTSNCPSWLMPLADKTGYELIPSKVKIVQRIFELAASGLGANAVCDQIRAEKLPTLGTSAVKRAKDWTAPNVLALLKSRRVLGEFQSSRAGAEMQMRFPPIIDEDEFNKVQAAIAGRRNTGGRRGTMIPNLFTGICYCECGSPMRISNVKRDATYSYIRCVASLNKIGKCKAPAMPYHKVEEAILQWIEVVEEAAMLPEAKVTDPRTSLRLKHERAVRSVENAVESVRVADGTAAVGLLVQNLNRLIAEEQAIKKQLDQVVMPAPVTERLAATQAALERMREIMGRDFNQAVNAAELKIIRERLRTGLRSLLSKVEFITKIHKTAFSAARKAAGIKRAYQDPTFRYVVLYGDLVQQSRAEAIADRGSENELHSFYVQGGGLEIEYELPPRGNGSGLRYDS